MTLSTEINKVQYTCNGDTDTFPYTFKIIQSADLYVVYTDLSGEDTTWTESTEYTVTAVGEELGGNVVVEAAYVPASGTTLTIYREVPLTQESDYVENDPFHADTLESDLDRIIMITQQLDETFSRVIQLNITDGSNPDMTIPNLADRTDRYLGFDENGDLTVFAAPAQVIGEGTDNAITRYDGTDELQTSLATIDDSGNIYTPGNIVGTNISASYISGADAAFDYLTLGSGSLGAVTATQLTVYPEISEQSYIYDLDTSLLTIDMLFYDDLTGRAGYARSGLVRMDVAGEPMDFGTLCYKAADGKFYISKNTDESTLPAVAMAAEDADLADETIEFLLQGNAYWDHWTWTVGAVIYTGTTPTGSVFVPPTYIKPTDPGAFVQMVGFVIDENTIYFNPNYTYIEIAEEA